MDLYQFRDTWDLTPLLYLVTLIVISNCQVCTAVFQQVTPLNSANNFSSSKSCASNCLSFMINLESRWFFESSMQQFISQRTPTQFRDSEARLSTLRGWLLVGEIQQSFYWDMSQTHLDRKYKQQGFSPWHSWQVERSFFFILQIQQNPAMLCYVLWLWKNGCVLWWLGRQHLLWGITGVLMHRSFFLARPHGKGSR